MDFKSAAIFFEHEAQKQGSFSSLLKERSFIKVLNAYYRKEVLHSAVRIITSVFCRYTLVHFALDRAFGFEILELIQESKGFK